MKFRVRENLEKADKGRGPQHGQGPKSNKEAYDGNGKETRR